MEEKGYEILARKIKVKFSNRRYALGSGDRRLENVPATLGRLWYGRGKDFPSVGQLDYYCQLCRLGQLTEAECVEKFAVLEAALAHEFELLSL